REAAREPRGLPDMVSANALPGPGGRRPAPGGVGSRSLFALESFVAAALRSALRSAAALEARSYNPRRTVAPRPIRLPDILVPLAFILAAALSLKFL
ncbi:MAG: hypothetical protein M0Z80_07060, partial [Treponema sp.]|nr:hypothetical protein [Treponema sp.]